MMQRTFVCRQSALNIGNIYTELLGEFGRSVGAGVNLLSKSKVGHALNPISLGVNLLNLELNSLISFLQVSVAAGWWGMQTHMRAM